MDQQREHVETSLALGHPCRQCPEGSYEKGTVTETLERDDTVVVVKDVPALVCDVCRDSLLAAEEVERLQNILEQPRPRASSCKAVAISLPKKRLKKKP